MHTRKTPLKWLITGAMYKDYTSLICNIKTNVFLADRHSTSPLQQYSVLICAIPPIDVIFKSTSQYFGRCAYPEPIL